MNRNAIRQLNFVCVICMLAISAAGQGGGRGASPAGQQGGQGGQGAQAAGGAGGQQGLQGLSYTPTEWPSLELRDVKRAGKSKSGRTVICYRLARANGGVQPFVLEPIPQSDEIATTGFERPCGEDGDAEGDTEGHKECLKLKARRAKDKPADNHWSPCSSLESEQEPILVNQMLVVGIDISDLGDMGINVDQLKLLNINVTNQQGSAINPTPLRATFPSTSAGGGGSGSAGSAGVPKPNKANEVDTWPYVGTRPPNGGRPRHWEPGTLYNDGDVVSDASGVNYFVFKNRPKKLKGKQDYYSGGRPTDPFPVVPSSDWTMDGEVIWQEMDPPTGNHPEAKYWQANHKYNKDDVVCVARRKHYLENYDLEPVPVAQTMRDAGCAGIEAQDDPVALSSVVQNYNKTAKPKDRFDDKNFYAQYYFAVRGGQSNVPPADPLSLSFVQRTIYLAWPYQLPGDVIPTFNVNLVYTPPTPGAIWQPNMFYPAGSVVVPRVSNGHYYTAMTGGFSALAANEPSFPEDSPPRISDGTLVWLDSGTSAPTVPSGAGAGTPQSSNGGGGQGGGGQGGGGNGGGSGSGAAKPQLWFPNTHYLLGDVTVDPDNGHYYTVVDSIEGFSGSVPTAAGTTGTPAKDPFPKAQSPAQTLTDGEIQWVLSSTVSTGHYWVASKRYSIGDLMNTEPEGGSSYTMASSSATKATSSPFGSPNPFPDIPVQDKLVKDGDIAWRYAPAGTAVEIWKSGASYSTGAVIDDGRLHTDRKKYAYVMEGARAGTSGTINPAHATGFGLPATVADGDLLWADLGVQDGGSSDPPWIANHRYSLGDAVGSNQHKYRVVHITAGISGTDGTVFTIWQFRTVVDPRTPIKDGKELTWLDLGEPRPLRLTGFEVDSWRPNTYYCNGRLILVPGTGNGRYYEAQSCGRSGKFSPFLNLDPPYPITWADSGTTVPASVAGGQPADQNVSLINLTLPQSHSLSYFNIAAGVVIDFKKPLTFGFVPASSYPNQSNLPAGYNPGAVPAGNGTVFSVDSKTGCTISGTPASGSTPVGTGVNAPYIWECPIQTGSGAIPVDPVLVLTGYVIPVDAERPIRFRGAGAWKDFVPAPSLGISLSNPTTNFYLGLSNEAFVRNLQFFYGIGFHNTALTLAPGSSQPAWGGTGTPPAVATVPGFQKGFFFGATFNLSGFVQTLFGGGVKGQ